MRVGLRYIVSGGLPYEEGLTVGEIFRRRPDLASCWSRDLQVHVLHFRVCSSGTHDVGGKR